MKHVDWFSIPSLVFNKVGGIEFLLVCDFEMSKLSIKTTVQQSDTESGEVDVYGGLDDKTNLVCFTYNGWKWKHT